MRTLVRVVTALALLVVGAVTALATVAVHELTWGLPLAVAATAAALVALPPGWWTRLAFTLGWTGFVGWVVDPRPEGDYAISSDWRGWTVVGLALLLLVIGIATLPRPRPRTAVGPGA